MKQTLAIFTVLCAVMSASLAAKPSATPTKSADGSRPSPTGTFTGDYRDGRIRDVLFDIAKAGHLNLVMPTEINGSVTAHFEKMPVAKALDFVVGLAGADYRLDEGTVYLTKRAPAPKPSSDEPDARPTTVVKRQVVVENREYELYKPMKTERRAENRQEPVRVETRVYVQNNTSEAPRYNRNYDSWNGANRVEIHRGFYVTTWPTQVYHVPFGPYR